MNEIYQQIKSECELPVSQFYYTYRDFDGVLHWGSIEISFKDNDETNIEKMEKMQVKLIELIDNINRLETKIKDQNDEINKKDNDLKSLNEQLASSKDELSALSNDFQIQEEKC